MNARTLFWCTLSFSVILEFCVRFFDLWHWVWGRMDSVMHFAWGLNIFLFLVLFWRWEPRDALLMVFVWQMAWETVEIIGDHVTVQTLAMLDIFYMDGLKDTVVDILGGLAGWWLLSLFPPVKTRKTSATPYMRTYLAFALAGIAIGGIITLIEGESANLFIAGWMLAAAPATWLWVRRARA